MERTRQVDKTYFGKRASWSLLLQNCTPMESQGWSRDSVWTLIAAPLSCPQGFNSLFCSVSHQVRSVKWSSYPSVLFKIKTCYRGLRNNTLRPLSLISFFLLWSNFLPSSTFLVFIVVDIVIVIAFIHPSSVCSLFLPDSPVPKLTKAFDKQW